MMKFLAGLLVGFALLLMGAEFTRNSKAVGIATVEGTIFVLYDNGAVFVKSAFTTSPLELNSGTWQRWTGDLYQDSDAAAAAKAINKRYGQ